MIDFRTLENIEIERLLEVFNLSFSDYFVPLEMTLEQLKFKFMTENFSAKYSVLGFYNDSLVSFIFHFIDSETRKQRLYNGGTGVIPKFRGNKLTEKMYRFIIPKLKQNQIDSITLEVLSNNIQAIKSYQKVGFERSRILKCYTGSLKDYDVDNNINIKELDEYPWDQMSSFWDIIPTWQNSIQTIERQKKYIISLGAYSDRKLVGYIIYSQKNGRIMQICVDKNHRRKGIARLLLKNAIHMSEISIVNIDAKSLETATFFENLGLQNYVNQMELKLTL